MLYHPPVLLQRPLTAELVGLAGVGKTTLLRTLCQQQSTIQAGVPLYPPQQMLFWIRSSLQWFPIFLRHYRQERWFTVHELRSLVYLQAWHQAIAHLCHKDTTILLDHGPIFRLALLREFGPNITKSPQFEDWWQMMLDRWADTLDIIVLLDAPDAVLLERIHIRDRRHLVKNQPLQAGYEFLKRYRKSYEQIMAEVSKRKTVRVLRFNTDQETPEQISAQVLAAFADLSANS